MYARISTLFLFSLSVPCNVKNVDKTFNKNYSVKNSCAEHEMLLNDAAVAF